MRKYFAENNQFDLDKITKNKVYEPVREEFSKPIVIMKTNNQKK